MNDLGFGDIYLPMFAAIVSATMVLEILTHAFNYFISKRQVKLYQQFQEKIKSGEIEMPPELMGQMHPGMLGKVPLDIYPTTSGDSAPGQYL